MTIENSGSELKIRNLRVLLLTSPAIFKPGTKVTAKPSSPLGNNELEDLIKMLSSSNISYDIKYSYDLKFERFDETTVSLYPNPTEGKINITVPTNVSASFSILDLNGRVVYSGEVNGLETINLGSLQNGIYFVKLFEAETQSVVVKRFIIK